MGKSRRPGRSPAAPRGNDENKATEKIPETTQNHPLDVFTSLYPPTLEYKKMSNLELNLSIGNWTTTKQEMCSVLTRSIWCKADEISIRVNWNNGNCQCRRRGMRNRDSAETGSRFVHNHHEVLTNADPRISTSFSKYPIP
jgi:hypothetical protein